MRIEIEEKLIEYFSHINGESEIDRFNICAWIFDLAKQNADDAVDIIEYFCTKVDFMHSDCAKNPNAQYSYNDIRTFKDQYADVVDMFLNDLIKMNLSIENFYSQVWNKVLNDSDFGSTGSKVFALFYIWIDKRIPYYQVDDGISMNNIKFREISQEIIEDINKARYIIYTNKFSMRSNQASVLLELLDKYNKELEKRAVLMSHIMYILSRLSCAPNSDDTNNE